jgi:hypothetical protein
VTEPVVVPTTPETAPPAAPAGPPAADKGFPEGTPLTEMNDAQKAAYWQHYARKHEDTVKAFNGLTPQQVKDLQAKNEQLEAAQLSADEKALKQATKEASESARAAAAAEYLPQIQQLQVKSIASQIIQGEKLDAFLMIPPATFVADDGTIDEAKVSALLTSMYGDAGTVPPTGPRHQNFGQFAPPPPGAKPGAAGSAEANKRFGSKTKS